MKKLFFLSFLVACFMLAGQNAKSQDTLRLKNKTAVSCKVFKISDTDIEYKKWNNLEGPVYTIDRNKVLEIRFENGIVERFLPDEMDVAQEQAILNKRNAVKFDLFSPVFDKITFGYEHCVKVGWNMEMYASYISTGLLPNGIGHNITGDSKTQGLAFRFGNKFFLGSDYYVKGTRYAHPLKGRFVRIDVSFSQFSIQDVYEYTQNAYPNQWGYYSYYYNKGGLNVSQFGLGITYGRQFILGNMFTLQYNVGINYAGTASKFVVSETNIIPPQNGNYFNYYYYREHNYDRYGSIPNIIRLGELPIGISGNMTFGYILGGKKKEKQPEDVSK
ncbi:MAG TPA: hypothetical protein VD905_10780 [Flavobacteriales bacterium]|nr:hypothetical protein [Flavobacteriales bacterium]